MLWGGLEGILLVWAGGKVQDGKGFGADEIRRGRV